MAEFPLPEQPVQSHAGSTLNFDAVRRQITKNKAQVTKLEAGEWVRVTLGAKTEEAPGYQTLRARTESGGVAARLRGAVKVRAGEALNAGEAALTLPAGLRPPGTIECAAQSSAGGGVVTISTAGVLAWPGGGQGATAVIYLDNITFNLT